jgi:hypothetical protein
MQPVIHICQRVSQRHFLVQLNAKTRRLRRDDEAVLEAASVI